MWTLWLLKCWSQSWGDSETLKCGWVKLTGEVSRNVKYLDSARVRGKLSCPTSQLFQSQLWWFWWDVNSQSRRSTVFAVYFSWSLRLELKFSEQYLKFYWDSSFIWSVLILVGPCSCYLWCLCLDINLVWSPVLLRYSQLKCISGTVSTLIPGLILTMSIRQIRLEYFPLKIYFVDSGLSSLCCHLLLCTDLKNTYFEGITPFMVDTSSQDKNPRFHCKCEPLILLSGVAHILETCISGIPQNCDLHNFCTNDIVSVLTSPALHRWVLMTLSQAWYYKFQSQDDVWKDERYARTIYGLTVRWGSKRPPFWQKWLDTTTAFAKESLWSMILMMIKFERWSGVIVLATVTWSLLMITELGCDWLLGAPVALDCYRGFPPGHHQPSSHWWRYIWCLKW